MRGIFPERGFRGFMPILGQRTAGLRYIFIWIKKRRSTKAWRRMRGNMMENALPWNAGELKLCMALCAPDYNGTVMSSLVVFDSTRAVVFSLSISTEQFVYVFFFESIVSEQRRTRPKENEIAR